MARKEVEYDGKRHSVDLALAKIEDATVTLRRKKPLSSAEQSLADHVVMQLGETLGIHVQVPMRDDVEMGGKSRIRELIDADPVLSKLPER